MAYDRPFTTAPRRPLMASYPVLESCHATRLKRSDFIHGCRYSNDLQRHDSNPGCQWPLSLTWFKSNPSMDKHMPSKVWDEITYPFPNFNGCIVEVWEWISNVTPHSNNGCNYLSMLGLKLIYVGKRGHRGVAPAITGGRHTQFHH